MTELFKIDVPDEYAPNVYIYKRERGWCWKFKLPDSKWFYGFISTDETAARRSAKKKEKQLAKGLFTQEELNKVYKNAHQALTFDVAIKEYIDHLKLEGASPNYYKSLEVDLRSTASFFEKEGVKVVYKLTEENAYSFRKHLLTRIKNKKMAKVTGFRQLNDVKRLFKWLRKRKKIPLNPWLEIDPISVSKEEKSRNVIPPIYILPQLLSANYQHHYAFPIKEFAYGLFRTGARKDELLFLEVDDVNWSNGHWLIRPKECPTQHGGRWSPKYGKVREAMIPSDVLEMLKPLVERAMNHRVVGYGCANNIL